MAAGGKPHSRSFHRQAPEALRLMEQAIAILDSCDPDGGVAPHLDLAICRLKDRLGVGRGE